MTYLFVIPAERVFEWMQESKELMLTSTLKYFVVIPAELVSSE